LTFLIKLLENTYFGQTLRLRDYNYYFKENTATHSKTLNETLNVQ